MSRSLHFPNHKEGSRRLIHNTSILHLKNETCSTFHPIRLTFSACPGLSWTWTWTVDCAWGLSVSVLRFLSLVVCQYYGPVLSVLGLSWVCLGSLVSCLGLSSSVVGHLEKSWSSFGVPTACLGSSWCCPSTVQYRRVLSRLVLHMLSSLPWLFCKLIMKGGGSSNLYFLPVGGVGMLLR
jgi:hypothetical protein